MRRRSFRTGGPRPRFDGCAENLKNLDKPIGTLQERLWLFEFSAFILHFMKNLEHIISYNPAASLGPLRILCYLKGHLVYGV